MNTYYIQKNILRSREDFGYTDAFVSLNKLVSATEVISNIQEDIADLQDDVANLQLGTEPDVVIQLTPTQALDSVAALDIAMFVVPASLNGKTIKDVRARHYNASTGATLNTSVQLLRNSTDLFVGSTHNIPAQSLTWSTPPTLIASPTVSNGDVLYAYVAAIPAGGNAPKGLTFTIVIGDI